MRTPRNRKAGAMRMRRFRHPFEPTEPMVTTGSFVGRRLSDLSVEELEKFLRRDARRQNGNVFVSPDPPYTRSYQDLSQYWFAKYELERRKPAAHRTGASSLEIGAGDTKESVALKLVNYGYRAASLKHHPDHGGSNETTQRLNEACQFARERLKGVRAV